jgi:hypothetical protein
MKPGTATGRIQERIPFVFNMHHFVLAYRKVRCRPAANVTHPERTDERYCVYDEPHHDYLYTQAFVEKVVRETGTASKFAKFLGTAARPKASGKGSSPLP